MGLGIWVIVGVGVHVIGEGSPLPVNDDLDPGYANAISFQEPLIGRDQRVVVAFHDAELLRWGDGRASGRSDGRVIDLASVCWAQFKPLARVDPDGVEE